VRTLLAEYLLTIEFLTVRKKIKLMPDDNCFALWCGNSAKNVSCRNLPLSDVLKNRIEKWELRHDATYNPNEPQSAGFENNIELVRFDEEGTRIWHAIAEELRDEYTVAYFSILDYKYHFHDGEEWEWEWN